MKELSLQEISAVAGAGIARNIVTGAIIGAIVATPMVLVSETAAGWLIGASVGAGIPMLYGLADYIDGRIVSEPASA